MNRFVHSLAQAAVLVHMVCGCCWHHAHACTPAVPDHQTAETARCVGHDHDRCPFLAAGHDSAPERQACGEGTCDFVRAESDASCHLSPESRLVAPAQPEVVRADFLARHAAISTAAGLGPPVRLHLVLQKLLV